MKVSVHERTRTVEDDFWTTHIPLFTAQFPNYYTKPQQVFGRFHTSEERYFDSSHEIIPIIELRINNRYNNYSRVQGRSAA